MPGADAAATLTTAALPPLGAIAATTLWSWRAVGWSKTSVLGSDLPAAAALWSWLRSSTAPSESTPASVS
eukprot:4963429-Prymnesium_polylepis.1